MPDGTMPPRARLEDLKEGGVVYLDEGFTCMAPGEATVQAEGEKLFLFCSDGRHYLDGQLEEDGTLAGVFTGPLT